MDKTKILADLEDMNSEELIHELRETRRRTVDFITYQQKMYIELQNRAVEEKKKPEAVAEVSPAESEVQHTAEPVEGNQLEAEANVSVEELLISEEELTGVVENAVSSHEEFQQLVEHMVNMQVSFHLD